MTNIIKYYKDEKKISLLHEMNGYIMNIFLSKLIVEYSNTKNSTMPLVIGFCELTLTTMPYFRLITPSICYDEDLIEARIKGWILKLTFDGFIKEYNNETLEFATFSADYGQMIIKKKLGLKNLKILKNLIKESIKIALRNVRYATLCASIKLGTDLISKDLEGKADIMSLGKKLAQIEKKIQDDDLPIELYLQPKNLSSKERIDLLINIIRKINWNK